MHNQSCTPTTTQAHRHNLSHHEMAALKIVLVENLKASSYHDDTVEEDQIAITQLKWEQSETFNSPCIHVSVFDSKARKK